MRVNRIFLAINLITLLLSFFFVQVAIANDASQSDAFNPRPDRAAIFIYRNEFIGMLYDMEVHVNGEQIKPLPSYKYYRLDVAAGTYKIGSPLSLNITVEAGKRYFIWRKIGFGSQVYFVAVDEEKGLKEINSCKLFAQKDIGEVPIAVASNIPQSEHESTHQIASGGYDPSNPVATTGFDANNTPPRDVIVKGAFKFNGGEYTGDMLNGKPTGTGVYKFANGNKYEGSVANGKFNGWGQLTLANGLKHEGLFVNNAISGEGTRYLTNGSIISGNFNGDAIVGIGTFKEPKSGSYFKGYFDKLKLYNGDVYSSQDNVIGKVTNGEVSSIQSDNQQSSGTTTQSDLSVGEFFQGVADVISALAPVIEGVQESRQRRSGYSNAQFERDMQALTPIQSNTSVGKRSDSNNPIPVTNDNFELNSNKTKSFEARDRYDPSIKYEGSTDRFGNTTVREKYDPTATKYKGELDKNGEGKLKDYNGNGLELKN